MDKKQEFLDLYDKYIKRDGADELKKYLVKSDFFTAPASSKYHCNHEGGLCEHSVNTCYRLLKNIQNEYGKDWEKVYSYETIAICGLLHDLCKIDFYKLDYRNVKENGEWVKKPWYKRLAATFLPQKGDTMRDKIRKIILLLSVIVFAASAIYIGSYFYYLSEHKLIYY